MAIEDAQAPRGEDQHSQAGCGDTYEIDGQIEALPIESGSQHSGQGSGSDHGHHH